MFFLFFFDHTYIMEYVKGKPYFSDCVSRIKQYPYLQKDLNCDILIIGGGIYGAIANFYLSKKYDVALVDKGRLGFCCTSSATALLEYQLDEFASDLKNYMSENDIFLVYKSGLNAIKKIYEFIDKYGNHCNFNLRPTFLYTDSIFTQKYIINEYKFRKKYGLNVELYTANNNPFPFNIKSGIYCPDGGCEFNPYLFTKQMIENSNNQDKIFENTNINQLVKQQDGYIAISSFGEKIKCKKIIIATGFNWEILNKSDLCERFVTYSIVTEPIKNFEWFNKAMIHDANSPYHYFRLLPDNRIIFGGEDTKFNEKPISENKANQKYNKLIKDMFKLFPQIKGAKIDYKFCGSFGTTDNNMGLIGKSAFDDNILLFISCGANGIINAIMGAEIIDSILTNSYHHLINIFSPKR